jgi:hypothetical protein
MSKRRDVGELSRILDRRARLRMVEQRHNGFAPFTWLSNLTPQNDTYARNDAVRQFHNIGVREMEPSGGGGFSGS